MRYSKKPKDRIVEVPIDVIDVIVTVAVPAGDFETATMY